MDLFGNIFRVHSSILHKVLFIGVTTMTAIHFLFAQTITLSHHAFACVDHVAILFPFVVLVKHSAVYL